MDKITLVILAAGIGSRYGNLKQIDSYTPEGDTIVDFSIYDGIQAGFNKVVFIIRRSIEKEFKAIFNKKLDGKIEVEYIYQETENIPKKYLNSKRIKPWGTGHALLMAKDMVKENFAIINADDFYGRQAFENIAACLKKTNKDNYDFFMNGYSLKNTLSDNGYVSRGECTIDTNEFLIDIIERVQIEKINGILKNKNEDGTLTTINENTIVSMNFWGFTPKCFEFIDALFLEFLEENSLNLKAEFYLPQIVNKMLQTKKVSVKVLKSNSKWFGVTYSGDKQIVEKEIISLIEKGVYPKKLWN